MRTRKGDFDYISHQRKVTLLQTGMMFGISLGIFFAGYFYYGKDIKNFLTLVAVLGFLPASKSLVSAIMFLGAKKCSEDARGRILESGENFHHHFNFYFTSDQKNYPVSHMIFLNQVLLGVTEWEKCDCRECEKHLINHLKIEGIKDIAVKIYHNMDQYCERLAELHYEYDPIGHTADKSDREEKVLAVLKAISL